MIVGSGVTPTEVARPGPGQRVAAAGALAVLAVSLGAAAHILWAQWRPLAASLVLGFVATTFLWQALTTRGPVRLANGVVATLCAAAVIAAGSDIVGEGQELLILGAGAVVSGAFARAALAVRPRQEPRLPRPVHPALFVNPRSGCGQATRLDLAGRARRAGATVVMVEPGGNLRDLAEHAADGGADLLGVAGGDGSLGEVAGVAADRDLPFLVVPIGTRNHFARDAGLDYRHPAAALRALDDGTEIRVDLGQAGERSFVNNISFGLYADAVSQPGYRDAKTATLLDCVPDFAGPAAVASGLRCTSPTHAGVIDPAIVVVSNNPYLPGGLSTPRTRASLSRGQLGVLTLHARSGLDLAVLALAGPGPVEGNAAWSTPLVVVDAPSETVTAALDGEPVDIPAPVAITSWPAALRLRVPRRRNTALRASALLSSFTVVRLVACLTGRPDPARQQKPDSGGTIHRHDDRPPENARER